MTTPTAFLAELSHHRWSIPILAQLAGREGGRVAALAHAVGASRGGVRQAVGALIRLDLLRPNPGHGHPLDMRDRHASAAFLAAGLTGLAAWLIAYFVFHSVTEGGADALMLLPYLGIGAVLFGAPTVATVIALAAVPAFLVLRGTARLTSFAVLLAGGGLGILTRLLVQAVLGAPEQQYIPVPIAIFAGVVAAGAWWRVYTGRGIDAGARSGRGSV